MTVEEMIKAEARYAAKKAKIEGRKEISNLVARLIDDERFDDLKRSSTDECFQKQLLNEYNIAFPDFEDVND